MKYVDVPSLYEGDPVELALLASYQFDPDYFERRILRSTSLAEARRIIVFVDRAEWIALLRRDIPARLVNRRYLVVPVRHSTGHFHPKLALLLSDSGGRVLCCSNNLTRSGCCSNRELLNAVCFDFDGKHVGEMDVAKEAFAFFAEASNSADPEIRRIVKDWMQDASTAFPWLREPITEGRSIRLLSTYDGPLWRQLTDYLGEHVPTEFFVISPFHDADAELFFRLSRTWPNARIEVLAQQGYTTLPVEPLKRLQKLHVSEIAHEKSRRLHAKLLSWRHPSHGGCLIGSANFSCEAFDGRNVETCLLLLDADASVGSLFDSELKKRPVALKDFEPGVAEATASEDPDTHRLNVEAAILTANNKIRVTYSHNLKTHGQLALGVRMAGERHPRVTLSLPWKSSTAITLAIPPNALAGAHGALLVNLVAETVGKTTEGPLVWVIQEEYLTYEPGEGGGTAKKRTEETGEGLHELLDEIGRRDGIPGVIEFLRHFNIRFHDGDGHRGLGRPFRITVRDPFQPDVAPDWLKDLPGSKGDLRTAIMEFVDRHQDNRLRKHAERGNINGIENFLDIFTALVRILHVYTDRGVVTRPALLGRLCRFIELATAGSNDEDDPFDGYLTTTSVNLGRGRRLLRERCEETNYLAVVYTALLIARQIRADAEAQPARGFLPSSSKLIEDSTAECGLQPPPQSKVREALLAYRMFPDDEIGRLLKQLD